MFIQQKPRPFKYTIVLLLCFAAFSTQQTSPSPLSSKELLLQIMRASRSAIINGSNARLLTQTTTSARPYTSDAHQEELEPGQPTFDAEGQIIRIPGYKPISQVVDFKIPKGRELSKKIRFLDDRHEFYVSLDPRDETEKRAPATIEQENDHTILIRLKKKF